MFGFKLGSRYYLGFMWVMFGFCLAFTWLLFVFWGGFDLGSMFVLVRLYMCFIRFEIGFVWVLWGMSLLLFGF